MCCTSSYSSGFITQISTQMNYAKLAFTDAVKKLQEQNGSRKSYERMEQFTNDDGLSAREARHIQNRDSFYLATYGENGFPYIQHRGGPKGFLKVLKEEQARIEHFFFQIFKF